MNRVQPTQAPRTQKNRRQRVTIAAVQERKKKKKKKKKKILTRLFGGGPLAIACFVGPRVAFVGFPLGLFDIPPSKSNLFTMYVKS
jgi:hypothetical protein